MSSGAFWATEKGVFIRFVVRPKSKEKEFIREITPEYIHVNLSSPAREGKANTELVKKLAKILKVSTSQVALVSGHKSREKTIFIQDGEIDIIRRALQP
jgi:uncharacterized protein (TIGR00251 family)